ncbi:AMP-binding protein [Nocardia aurantia]|uniref:Long-chain-fatty-acid--CoA ligase n=1 Tax=Nocardia aurantia TaxID=2585199 RepID=A0A7K0DGD5_9NOCA|nr:AMP-binding protein [Nocardia aurantia]MQY24875.1 Long-chain-fatty-acid--CoA ligase [Nocardia aurantia]
MSGQGPEAERPRGGFPGTPGVSDPGALVSLVRALGRRAWAEAEYLRLCAVAGLVGPRSVGAYPAAANALFRYGSLVAALSFSAQRCGGRAALIDESGALSYAEVDDRSNRLANEWRTRGLRAGETVALLVRNHRGLFDALFAAAKCGTRILLLNPDFAAPRLAEIAERDGMDLLVYDQEFEAALGTLSPRRGAYRAWTDSPHLRSLETLVAAGSSEPPPVPAELARVVLPNGVVAAGAQAWSLRPLGALLSRVPLRAREVTECPVPLFHSLGFAMALVSVGLGSTLVIRRRFEPRRVLDSMARNRATALIVAPVMLSRLTDLDPLSFTESDLSALRVVLVGGSRLGGDLCRRTAHRLGSVLYHVYGSTAAGCVAVATPADLAAEPRCAGRPLLGTVVRIVDEAGDTVPTGTSGAILAGNTVPAGDDRLVPTGDLGRFDAAGRLFVDGRAAGVTGSGNTAVPEDSRR